MQRRRRGCMFIQLKRHERARAAVPQEKLQQPLLELVAKQLDVLPIKFRNEIERGLAIERPVISFVL